MQLKKVKNPSVVQQVIDSLTDAMIRKELRPGDKIPTENELSESLGVARNSVREAIKILVFLGVLEIRRPEGTFVCDGFSESMINPMIYGIILNQGDSWDSLMELREMTEAGVIRLAIEKETQEDLDRLKSALAAMKEAFFRVPQDLQASFEADNHFHDTIMEKEVGTMLEKLHFMQEELGLDIPEGVTVEEDEKGFQALQSKILNQISEVKDVCMIYLGTNVTDDRKAK